ncbi:MAG: hypothetical protein KAQ71_10770, partial [Desulfobulbaceae bacterium]|nr:hypothetical protein [Desulfobulbaceae bacterium]
IHKKSNSSRFRLNIEESLEKCGLSVKHERVLCRAVLSICLDKKITPTYFFKIFNWTSHNQNGFIYHQSTKTQKI